MTIRPKYLSPIKNFVALAKNISFMDGDLLHNVTSSTLNRTCPALLVAALATGVQGIAPFRVAVRAVAILTTTRTGVFLLFVMAIIARNTIPLISGVCLVIKQNLSRSALEHEPYGFFRGFLRQGSVTNNAYDEQNCRKDKCKRLFSL
jgi:hypothetical protein